MCGLLQHLVETTRFLLHVRKKKAPNLGGRKFSIIAQHQSEVTVTSNVVLFKKVRALHTKLKKGRPHSNLGAVEWPFEKFPRIFVTNTGNVVC
jgi:hypothetical protein